MKKQFHLTKEGVNELEKELENLKDERPQVAERLSAAREQGDLSENAEYAQAREDLSRIEGRIKEINHILSNYDLVKSNGDGKVGLGSTVELKNSGKKVEYTVVSSLESDPSKRKISDESPIGRALMGKKPGDKVDIKTPGGTHTYEIKKIT